MVLNQLTNRPTDQLTNLGGTAESTFVPIRDEGFLFSLRFFSEAIVR
jgi:hypothetical protein